MDHPISLQSHRKDHNASKLPKIRFHRLRSGSDAARDTELRAPSTKCSHNNNNDNNNNNTTTNTNHGVERPRVARSQSESAAAYIKVLRLKALDLIAHTEQGSASWESSASIGLGLGTTSTSQIQTSVVASGNHPASPYEKKPASTRKMSTAGSHPESEDPTKDWVLALPSADDDHQTQATQPKNERRKSYDTRKPQDKLTPLIKPIRAFKTSRKSMEAANAMDDDTTLKALDQEEQEPSSDDSDLFLRAAREEAAASANAGVRGPIRRSQLNHNRQSLPPNHSIFQNPQLLRRGSDQESSTGRQTADERVSQALTYRQSTTGRSSTALDTSRNRHVGAQSTPSTPRALRSSREISPPDSQVSYGGRRTSVPDQNQPVRASSYRQSNLSYANPRVYSSSPLVSRTTDGVRDAPEVTRAAEGTESSVSTTAPSTVWDELEDLKSRIHRLELTGKLPASSGAAISRTPQERPPTATTTATTMSSSPKQRGRGNSISPTETNGGETNTVDTHPLLSAALAKSKTLLNPEVYTTLEATAADALALASMMGTAGQPGPISSSQSTVGGPNTVTDRQVRRKADSMCRSLTELCLALSEGKVDQTQHTQVLVVRPSSRDAEAESVAESNPRLPSSADLARVKASPRALSRLEARRSSLLATSTLPSPRYATLESGTPTQSSMAGRRTSMLLRTRRGTTEEPEEDDESRFRAPSRATTEIGRLRNSPREYGFQQPDDRLQPIPSSLPVRRHYVSTSLGNSGAPPVTAAISNLGNRRYLDRTTPERETNGLAGRMAEERTQRKASIGQGFLPLGRTGSLNRRTRQPQMGDPL